MLLRIITFYISAIYLGLTLTFSTISVNIVILIIDAYYKGDKEAPDWIDTICRKLCCHRGKCDTRINKVIPSDMDGGMNQHDIIAEILQTGENFEVEKLTYRQFSEILDQLFFVIYMIAITATTLIFLILLLVHYHSSLWHTHIHTTTTTTVLIISPIGKVLIPGRTLGCGFEFDRVSDF